MPKKVYDAVVKDIPSNTVEYFDGYENVFASPMRPLVGKRIVVTPYFHDGWYSGGCGFIFHKNWLNFASKIRQPKSLTKIIGKTISCKTDDNIINGTQLIKLDKVVEKYKVRNSVSSVFFPNPSKLFSGNILRKWKDEKKYSILYSDYVEKTFGIKPKETMLAEMMKVKIENPTQEQYTLEIGKILPEVSFSEGIHSNGLSQRNFYQILKRDKKFVPVVVGEIQLALYKQDYGYLLLGEGCDCVSVISQLLNKNWSYAFTKLDTNLPFCSAYYIGENTTSPEYELKVNYKMCDKCKSITVNTYPIDFTNVCWNCYRKYPICHICKKRKPRWSKTDDNKIICDPCYQNTLSVCMCGCGKKYQEKDMVRAEYESISGDHLIYKPHYEQISKCPECGKLNFYHSLYRTHTRTNDPNYNCCKEAK